ncbi:MAG: hypothetical protein ABI895_10030 [Deltaproteobacteria bacterium]
MVSSGPVVAEQIVKIDEPRRRMASMAGGPAQLENATRDLFRLTGGQSIPVEARTPIELKPKTAPAVSRRPDPPPSSGRNFSSGGHSKPAEASILFSLESLMRAATPSEKPDEPDQQLWNMQAETPLFGTSQDHALLTTPLEPPPRSAGMDSMTMSSRRPAGMRMLPLLLAVFGGCGVILVGAAWFVLRPPVAPPAPAQALETTPPALQAPGAEPAHAAVAAVAERKPATGGVAADPAPTAAKEPPEVKEEPAALAAPSSAAAKATAHAAVPPRATSSAKKPPPRATKPAVAAFDVDAAKNALNTAATQASACTGTSGKGKVQLTFAPTGKVSAAQLLDGPFAGTPAGKCALKHFRAAHIPAFSGSPQTVAKSFKIP